MKIALSPQQYFDLSGYPLVNGRLRVFLHDSQDLAPLFTLSGDVYSPAANPVTLDNAGEIHDTLWFDATIVDVKVDARNEDGTYRQVSQFEYGFIVPEAKNDTLTFGIEGLKVADPALGIVTVWGYDEHAVAPSRQYVWDADCTADGDDGCIVESTLAGADGKWLLLWDDEKLPCTVYGIAPGNEANISAFLSYPETVGTWSLRMPRIPRFLPGVYTSNATFTSNKTLYFDRGAQFLSAKFNCPKVMVAENAGGYIADFTLSSSQDVAESRWFRTAEAFFRCKARELYQAPVNYFTDGIVTRAVALGDVRLTGKFLDTVGFSGAGRLVFNGADIATGALSGLWNVQFLNMDVTDYWFGDSYWDVGSTSGHRQLASTGNCTFDQSNFRNANVWAEWLARNDVRSIDLAGRTVGAIPDWCPFRTISNGTVNELHLKHDCALTHVTCPSLSMEDTTASVALKDSNVIFDATFAAAIALERSVAAFNTNVNLITTAFTAKDSTVDISGVEISPVNKDDFGLYSSVMLERCSFTGGLLANNMLQVRDCSFADVDVIAYPILNAATNSRYISVYFEGNSLSGSSYLGILPAASGQFGNSNYEVEIGRFVVRNNRFDGSANGFRMPFWANDLQHRFIRGLVSDFGFGRSVSVPSWTAEAVYSGNTGNCPMSYPLPQDQVTGGGTFTYDYAGTTYTYAYSGTSQSARVFCLPASPDDGGYTQAGYWIVAPYGKLCTTYRAKCLNLTLNNDASFPVTALMPACAIDNTLPNDMFSVRFVCISTQSASGFQPLPNT